MRRGACLLPDLRGEIPAETLRSLIIQEKRGGKKTEKENAPISREKRKNVVK